MMPHKIDLTPRSGDRAALQILWRPARVVCATRAPGLVSAAFSAEACPGHAAKVRYSWTLDDVTVHRAAKRVAGLAG